MFPAEGIEIPVSFASSVNTPITPNSAIPRPNVPSANEKIVSYHDHGLTIRDGHYQTIWYGEPVQISWLTG